MNFLSKFESNSSNCCCVTKQEKNWKNGERTWARQNNKLWMNILTQFFSHKRPKHICPRDKIPNLIICPIKIDYFDRNVSIVSVNWAI